LRTGWSSPPSTSPRRFYLGAPPSWTFREPKRVLTVGMIVLPMYQVVLDTNVLVSALRSKRGASHRLMRLIGDARWQVIISVALVLEYEAVALRHCASLGIRASVATDIVDIFCAAGRQSPIHFRWRPLLRDPGDEFILDLAVAGQCQFIVTHNKRDFEGVEQFGTRAVTPREFLAIIGE